MQMARWVLEYPRCNKIFTQSNIPYLSSFLGDPFTGHETKPEFPDGGLKVECPYCNTADLYRRYQLTYRSCRIATTSYNPGEALRRLNRAAGKPAVGFARGRVLR